MQVRRVRVKPDEVEGSCLLSDAETQQMEATGVSSAAVQSCSAEQKALPLPLHVSLGSPSVSGCYGNNQTVTLVIRTVMPS